MTLRIGSVAFVALVLAGCFSSPPLVEDTSAGTDSSGTTGSAPSGTSVAGSTGSDSESATGTATPSSATEGSSSTGSGADSGSDSSTSEDNDAETTSSVEPAIVCPSFTDNFDEGDAFNPVWIPIDGESITVGDGEAVINVTADFNDEFARLQLLPEPNGLVGATARIEIGTPPPVEHVVTILWVQPSTSEDRITYMLANRGTEMRLEARLVPDMGSPVILNTAVWDPKMTWMQIREESGTLYFEASADGETFETIYDVENSIDVSSAFVGFVGNNGAPLDADVEVSVRTFEIICG